MDCNNDPHYFLTTNLPHTYGILEILMCKGWAALLLGKEEYMVSRRVVAQIGPHKIVTWTQLKQLSSVNGTLRI